MPTIQLVQAENVKRIEAVEVKPTPTGLEIVAGRNEQGKSSLLDAIEMALGGQKAVPDVPIRKGADSARIVVQTDSLVVTRTFTDQGSYLKVEDTDGRRFGSPQAILDKLVGTLTFDPLGFLQMTPAQQADVLIDVAGVRKQLAELDSHEEEACLIRRDAKRDLGQANGELVGKPAPEGEVPEERIDVKAVATELQAARQKHWDYAGLEKQHNTVLEANEGLRQNIASIEAQIKQLQAAITQRQQLIAKQATDAEQLMAQMQQLEGDGLPAIKPLEERIETADGLNQRFDQWQSQTKAHDEAKQKMLDSQQEVQLAEKGVNRTRAERRKLLAGLKTPLKGLTLAEDAKQVVWGELPFEQASQSEQLRVSLAITAALNPKLRIALVRDGSLLDDEHLAELAKWATAQKFQVWLERVNTDGASVVIEDGRCVDEKRPTAVVAPGAERPAAGHGAGDPPQQRPAEQPAGGDGADHAADEPVAL